MAEDIELSIRMKNAGFRSVLIPDAFVYHKRRVNFEQFYNQVSNFGRGRIQVGRAHPGAVKLTHWLPAFFTVGLFSIPAWYLLSKPLFILAMAAYSLFTVALFFDSYRQHRNLTVAGLSIPSAYVQLIGYGIGFMKELFKA
jgi:cellulose synthase/poly-beta-1,6-N-acetylglucosamine synthase-like glycosyltransferase